MEPDQSDGCTGLLDDPRYHVKVCSECEHEIQLAPANESLTVGVHQRRLNRCAQDLAVRLLPCSTGVAVGSYKSWEV